MSLGKRILDLAKANLNALLDQTGGRSEASIDDLTDDELKAELERRAERRKREEAERKGRQTAERAARERAAPRAQKTRPRTESPPRAASSNEQRLRELHKQLEVPYGASFEDIKKSFRRLMRKYHPDLHAGNPKKHKAATQLTMSLTQAYNELEAHWAIKKR